MIDIKIIASGSSGNCYRIADNHTTLMIEAGIQFKKIQQAFSFKLSNVAGCLISHEHGDHARATKGVMKAGINCYMSEGSATAFNISGHRLKIIKPKELFSIGSFQILPFTTQHDCAEPLGFLIRSRSGEKVLFITDSFYCAYKFKGLTHILVECNYSKGILDENITSGVCPAFLKNRITKSHFELENVKEFLRETDLSWVKQIYLIHISDTNGNGRFFKEEIQKLTGKEVYIK